jgi:hypothetical protein
MAFEAIAGTLEGKITGADGRPGAYLSSELTYQAASIESALRTVPGRWNQAFSSISLVRLNGE